jgi:hypothetical protein
MLWDHFTPRQRSILRRLDTPEKIQCYLDRQIPYNTEPDGETCRSPKRVLRDHLAHCLEGAMFAAAALRAHGAPPLLLDLASVRDDDHVIAIYRKWGCWGAIAKSDYSGLRFREPVYRTLRELVMSYFEHYFNPAAEKTLRAYSRPINLARFDHIQWMTSEQDLWPVSDYLCGLSHTRVLPRGLEARLTRVDDRLYAAGRLGAKK